MSTIVTNQYGPYILTARFDKGTDFAQVTMELRGEDWPIRWSKGMTWAQANSAITLFKAIGYFDAPVDVEMA